MKNNYILILGCLLIILSYSNSLYNYSNDKRIMMGYLVAILSYTFFILENYKEKKIKYRKSQMLFVLYYSIKIFFRVELHTRYYDILGLIGNLLLITKNKYNKKGKIIKTVYYLLLTYNNIFKTELFSKIKGCGSLLLFISHILEFLKTKSHDNTDKNN